MALNYVTLSVTSQDAGQDAGAGAVTVIPTSVVTASGVTVVSQDPVVRQLSGGTASVLLVASDNAGTSPAAGFWAYSIQVGSAAPQLYLVNFANGSTQRLDSLTPVVAKTTYGPAAVGGFTNPMTTLGDLIYENATPAAARLPGDTSNARKFLRTQASGGVAQAPAWDTIQAGDLPLQPWQFQPEAYGALGNGKVVGDVATTSGSKVITSATAGFTAADVGKTVMVNGGNGTLAGPYVDVIASVQSATQATLTTSNAGATASGCAMVWGTDDTAAINSAVSAAKTYALANDYFAEIIFGAKVYMVAAAPTQTSGAGGQVNAQIPIPYPNVNGQSRKLVISLRGAGNAGQTQFWESTIPNLQGTCLVSTQTAPAVPSATFGQQSVIGGPSAGGAFTGSFANTKVIIDGITVWHGMLTNQYAYDFGYVASMEWGSFSSQAFAPAANLGGATAAHPYQSDMTSVSTTIGVGCRFPLVGNNDDVAGVSFACQGIDLPFIIADHFTCLRVATVYQDVGCRFDLVNGISAQAHGVFIGLWSIEAYNGGLQCNGGGSGFAFVNITMDTETIGGSADPVYDVSDNGNLYGVLRVTDAGGRTSRKPVVLNGAPHLKVINDMMGPGYWSGAPAVPASGTPQQNTAWRDAAITVTTPAGVTVSAITIDGQATGLTMAASSTLALPLVPGGKTVTLTYAGGTPTWKWWLGS